VRVVADGEVLRVGDLAITAHMTPGHTPGAATWTWRSCEGERCLDVVYADSLNAVSLPGFRFTGDAKRPSIVASFERSLDVVAALPCDILLAVHPSQSPMYEKLKKRGTAPEAPPVADKNACRVYSDAARQRLKQRIADEAGSAPAAPSR
jgi:metallo-beta-lactamase class B